jgi:hypothetical protein
MEQMIDAVLYINLDQRKDRKKHIEKELATMGIDSARIHRIPAIYEPLCGHLGCALSHVKALELIQEKGWATTLILEDDFQFKIGSEEFDLILAEPVAWDVLLLAKGWGEFEPATARLNRVKWCTTTSGYVIRRPYVETLLANFNDAVVGIRKHMVTHAKKCEKEGTPVTKLIHGVWAIDHTWKKLQKTDAFYITEPVAGKQAPFTSNTF